MRASYYAHSMGCKEAEIGNHVLTDFVGSARKDEIFYLIRLRKVCMIWKAECYLLQLICSSCSPELKRSVLLCV